MNFTHFKLGTCSDSNNNDHPRREFVQTKFNMGIIQTD